MKVKYFSNTLNLRQDSLFLSSLTMPETSSCAASMCTLNYIFMLLVVLNFLAHGQFLDKRHRKILWPCWRWVLRRGEFQTLFKTAEYFQVLPNIWACSQLSMTHDIDEWCRVEESPPKAIISNRTWAAINTASLTHLFMNLSVWTSTWCWSCSQSNVALERSLSPKLRGGLWCLKNNQQ